ncbi:MAG: hypothetical protein EKK39_14255 [Sphingobacteriales bacterium]|nr:MAG: hypothetical protein EKK39_14255 [Sphingobacteriales bacterium]
MNDILLDNNLDIAIQNGDFVVGECTQQNQQLLLMAGKGTFKEFPTTGVGLNDFIESEDTVGLLREVKAQFSADGMTVNSLGFNNSKLVVDAHY